MLREPLLKSESNNIGIKCFDTTLSSILDNIDSKIKVINPYINSSIDNIGLYVTQKCKIKHLKGVCTNKAHETFRFMLKNGIWYKCNISTKNNELSNVDFFMKNKIGKQNKNWAPHRGNNNFFYIIKYRFIGILLSANKMSVMDVFWDDNEYFNDFSKIIQFIKLDQIPTKRLSFPFHDTPSILLDSIPE